MLKKNLFPEAEFIRRTFTLREMDLPPNVRLTKRSLLRWFALASGLISEAESRSTVLDVLDSLLYLQLSKRIKPTTNDIQAYLKIKNRTVSEKLLRYHLKRLVDLGLVRRKKLRYSFNPAPNAEPDNLREAFSHNIGKRVTNAVLEIESGIDRLVDSYKSL
jgi:predicted transcriptional regulator